MACHSADGMRLWMVWMQTRPKAKYPTATLRKRPGWALPTLSLGALKKKTSSRSIGRSSRNTFSSDSTRHGSSMPVAPHPDSVSSVCSTRAMARHFSRGVLG